MQIISNRLNDSIMDDSDCSRLFGSGVRSSDLLYLDLETTGLSADRNRIYLIGCACRHPEGWFITQWFDDNGRSEELLLQSLLVFARDYRILVHFNGDRFDLPFLQKRMEHYGLQDSLLNRRSVDLYRAVRPYGRILGLPSIKQQSLEAFYGTGRKEETSGAEQVVTYERYLQTCADDDFNTLIQHNRADVAGLISISRVLLLNRVLEGQIIVKKARADRYLGIDGEKHSEIVMEGIIDKVSDTDFPAEITLQKDGCTMLLSGSKVIIKIPVVTGELKYFYADYRDYYYLPAEDQAIHKSIASFVDPSHRQQAKASNCYTRKSGTFLPEWELFKKPFFKKSYEDRQMYFEFLPSYRRNREFFQTYGNHLYRHILSARG